MEGETDPKPDDAEVIIDPEPDEGRGTVHPSPDKDNRPAVNANALNKIISIRVTQAEYDRWEGNVKRRMALGKNQNARHLLTQLQDECKATWMGGMDGLQ